MLYEMSLFLSFRDRRQPSQGNYRQGHFRNPSLASEAFQSQPRLPVRIHESTPGLRQLHSSHSQVLQSGGWPRVVEHSPVGRSEQCARVDPSVCHNVFINC